MEHGDFERRRREKMIKNGDDTSSLDAALDHDDQTSEEPTASQQIAIILDTIDKIIPRDRTDSRTPYNVRIREYVEALLEQGMSAEEVFDDLVNERLASHPALTAELGRRGISSMHFIKRRDPEFDR